VEQIIMADARMNWRNTSQLELPPLPALFAQNLQPIEVKAGPMLQSLENIGGIHKVLIKRGLWAIKEQRAKPGRSRV
jgi:hypothetical protein